MTTMSWVAGSTPVVVASGTVVNATTPAGIQDGDGLFAFFYTRSDPTPPAGWTLVDSAVETSISQRLYCYQKNVVTAADASTSFAWVQASSARGGVTYAVARPSEGVVRARGVGKFESNSTTALGFTVPSVGAAQRDQSLILVAGSTVVVNSNMPTPTITGYTVWHDAYAEMRLAACYQTKVAGEPNDANFFTIRNTSAASGMVGLAIRVETSLDTHTVIEQVNMGEAQDPSGSTYSTVLAETVRFDLTAIWGTQYVDALVDALTLAWATAEALPDTVAVSDTMQLLESAIGVRGQPVTVSDTVGLDPVSIGTYALLTREFVRVADNTGPATSYRLTLTDAVRAAALLRAGSPMSLSETMALATVAQAVAGVRVVERLGLQAVLGPALRAGASLLEALTLSDALRRFVSGEAIETIGMQPVLAGILRATPTLTDTVGVQPVVSPQMVLRVTAPESLRISGTEALQMLFKPTIVDDVVIDAGYVAPDGSMTVWAVNARTGAVTEYRNFAFNSFARVGNHYAAAGPDGLYQLTGDTDDGTDIIAQIRSGLMQLGMSRFTQFKGAYLAVRGGGSFVLRLETPQGGVVNYNVVAEDMETTKINIGKGLRTRYFSFELISTGQDFDLDTLEFVPIVAQRRV